MGADLLPEDRIFAIEGVKLEVEASEHPWAVAQADRIDAHWARERVRRPFLYNGTVLMHRGLELADGVISGVSHRVPYAALLHWIEQQPQADVWHLFGAAVILSSDDAMLLIRMAEKTANAGKIYAPAGSLDENDIRNGTVDVDLSILRETLEETGIDLSGAPAEKQLLCCRQGRRVTTFRRFRLDRTAETLAAEVRRHISAETDPEIEDVVIVRGPGDVGPMLKSYMKPLIDFHFANPDFDCGWQPGGID